MSLDQATMMPLLAGVLGALCGGIELWARYFHAPKVVFRRWPALLYFGVNGLAAVGALLLLRELQPNWYARAPLFATMLAAVGAMAILRSSVIRLPGGKRGTEIGFAGIVELLLETADKEIETTRYKEVTKALAEDMRGVDFAKAAVQLPLLCLQQISLVSKADQNEVAKEIVRLTKTNLPDYTRCLALGLILSKCCGTEIVACTLKTLGDSVRYDAKTGQEHATTIEQLIGLYSKETK